MQWKEVFQLTPIDCEVSGKVRNYRIQCETLKVHFLTNGAKFNIPSREKKSAKEKEKN